MFLSEKVSELSLAERDCHSLTPLGIICRSAGRFQIIFFDEKWHLLTLLGKYQTVFPEEKLPLVNYVEESALLGEENCSSTLWGIPKMRNRLSYLKKIVECRFAGESRLRNSKTEQTISLRETTICGLA